ADGPPPGPLPDSSRIAITIRMALRAPASRAGFVSPASLVAPPPATCLHPGEGSTATTPIATQPSPSPSPEAGVRGRGWGKGRGHRGLAPSLPFPAGDGQRQGWSRAAHGRGDRGGGGGGAGGGHDAAVHAVHDVRAARVPGRAAAARLRAGRGV